jgi:hypothetical protein
MTKFYIEAEETIFYGIDVEAGSKKQAEQLVRDKKIKKKNIFVTGYDNFKINAVQELSLVQRASILFNREPTDEAYKG